MMQSLTIGQVAKQTGISHDTIRLYERYGLIDEPPRSPNGYRQYSLDAIERLTFILRSKKMGFTLKEIQELLSIHQSSKQSCNDVKQHAQEKLTQVYDKINELKNLERTLKQLILACEKHKPNDLCPIFTSLKRSRVKK